MAKRDIGQVKTTNYIAQRVEIQNNKEKALKETASLRN